MSNQTYEVDVEVRESEGDGPRLHGIILQEGRAAREGRAELFVPKSLVWPHNGIGINLKHHGRPEVRAVPVRDPDGNIRIAAPATPAIVEAVRAGRNRLSVEFHPIRATRTAGGVREIESALAIGATLTDRPEYHQTHAEVREAPEPMTWL